MRLYITMKEMAAEKGYPIIALCNIAHVAKSAYYKWLRHPKSEHELENEGIAKKIEGIHTERPELGHRRVRDVLAREQIVRKILCKPPLSGKIKMTMEVILWQEKKKAS